MIVRYITPFSTERNKMGYPNIGSEYNKCIAELPDDCYVCIRDGDTMFLTPDWGEYIKAIIECNTQFDLIGCVTNRVSIPELCVPGMFNDLNISNHVRVSNEIKNKLKNTLMPLDIVPGYFMLFHKSLWAKVGGFPEFDITFDRVFSDKVLKSGGKIGIATGLYIFHNYRMLSENPQSDIKHLRKRIKD